jgi:Protein of unknown function (DUF1552)
MSFRLSRRALLRGAGSVAIGLPFLEVMTPKNAKAAAAAPIRLFTHFTENGVVHPTWYPSGDETNFTLNKVHKPFETAGMKGNLIILDGLTITQTGNQGSAHMRAKTSNLTAWPNKGGNGRSEGQSIDQAVADKIQGPSRLRSIEAGVFVRGNFRDAIFHSKPGQAALTEDDPTKLFARVFSGPLPTAGPAMPGSEEEFKRQWERRKSILDGVLAEYKRVADRSSSNDRVRLDNHVSAIRDLEKALAPGNGGVASQSCKMPGAPEIGDFVKESRAQQEILIMALACDITRVANLHYMTNKVVFSWVGASGGTHHDISHRQKSQSDNLPELDAINTWYASQVVYIAERLKSFPDVDGRTVFDNTVIHWANELALGSHKFERAPYMLVAGKFPLPQGGFLRTGRYLKYPKGTLQSGLLCSLGQIFGLPISNFGHQMWHQGPLKNFI